MSLSNFHEFLPLNSFSCYKLCVVQCKQQGTKRWVNMAETFVVRCMGGESNWMHLHCSLNNMTYKPLCFIILQDNEWCIGWQDSGMQTKDGKEITLLGDLVLSNKLVLYDLENQSIGWTEYNCSSSIKVRDGTSGKVYTVGAHNISSASTLNSRMVFTFFILVISLLCNLLK
ncbi:hypothetical protein H5410_022690 [Solanum commersonii]|uniref:Peptidase A1 domain-containing protein n=1 Tax=Solanum commersonii TaxID=4109 RepID=A0A9J5ZET1_SOLCO|nr:hypothetical protein H5410_022690 [Solanum commersonii]